MRYIIAKTLVHAKQLEADPRVRGVCMLVETFTPRQRVFAWLLWRTPVLRWLFRPFLYRRFLHPYATIVFAIADAPAKPEAKPEATPAPQAPPPADPPGAV